MPCLFKVGTPRVCVFYSPPAPCCRQDLLFLQRRAENIKKSRTIGTSSAFDNISSGKNGIHALSLCRLADLWSMSYNVCIILRFLLSQPRVVSLYQLLIIMNPINVCRNFCQMYIFSWMLHTLYCFDLIIVLIHSVSFCVVYSSHLIVCIVREYLLVQICCFVF